MEPTLSGVCLKLDRAYEHFCSLREISPDIYRGHRILHDTIVKPHPDSHGYSFYLPPMKPLATDRWSILLGDILFSLRSALDQLVFQLHVIRYGGTVPNHIEKASAFPIWLDKPTGKKGVPLPTERWNRIGTLPQPQRALIAWYQPYRTGDGHRLYDQRRASLAMVDMLNNIDKHRRLHVVRHVAYGTRRPYFHPRYQFTSAPDLGEVKAGARIDYWRFHHISEDMREELARQVDMHGVALQEVLDEAGYEFPVFELTRHLQNQVLRVIRHFVPFFEEAGVTGRDLELPKPIHRPTWEHWVGALPI